MKFTTIGVQRSGTNYTASFLTGLGLEEVTIEFSAWKHDINPEHFAAGVDDDHLVILVSKHPVKWLESIIRNPVDVTTVYPYTQFGGGLIQRPHQYYGKQFNALSIESLCKHYNHFYSHWLTTKLFDEKIVRVRYEDLLKPDFVRRWQLLLCRRLGVPHHSSAIPLSVYGSGYRPKAYLDSYSKPTTSLSKKSVAYANDLLDSRLLARLGYTPLHK